METLHKGISKESNQWIEGFYVKELDGKEYILLDADFSYDGKKMLSYEEIVSGTVCTFIGKVDGFGKKVFSHDILESTGMQGKVAFAWSDEHGCFVGLQKRFTEFGDTSARMVLLSDINFEIFKVTGSTLTSHYPFQLNNNYVVSIKKIES